MFDHVGLVGASWPDSGLQESSPFNINKSGSDQGKTPSAQVNPTQTQPNSLPHLATTHQPNLFMPDLLIQPV